MSLTDRIAFVRNGMSVRRYHQYHTAEIDTVGKHSAGVALFIHLINPDASKHLIMAALAHDLGEQITGDVPSPAKKLLSQTANIELKTLEANLLADHNFSFLLTPAERALLKIADCFDGLAFCVEEAERGNKSLAKVAATYASYIPPLLDAGSGHWPWLATARNVYTTLMINLEKANGTRK